MQHFRSWSALWLAFYSRPFYVDVAKRWRGTGLGYLFCLVALASLPMTWKVGRIMEDVADNYLTTIIDRLPDLRIEQGVLKTEAPMPYVITLPGKRDPVVVIDSRTNSRPSDAELQAPVVVLSDRMIVDNQGDVSSYPFSAISDYRLDKVQAHAFLERTISLIKPLAFLPVVAVEFVYRLLPVLLFAAGGMVYAGLLRVRMPYRLLLRLTCTAVTPVVLLIALATLSGWLSVVPGWLLFLISQGYLFFAVQSVARDQHQHGAGPSDRPDVLEV